METNLNEKEQYILQTLPEKHTPGTEISQEEGNLSSERSVNGQEKSSLDVMEEIQVRQDLNQNFSEVKTETKEDLLDQEEVKQKNGKDWLNLIPEERRVQVSLQLIETKQKSPLEIIDAFLEIDDLSGLDTLASLLAEDSVFMELLEKKILPKV